MLRFRIAPLSWFLYFLLLAPALLADSMRYLDQTGAPTFLTPEPVESGFINLANGKLHLDIPLGVWKQRGALSVRPKVVYESSTWEIVNNAWQPARLNTAGFLPGGWNFYYSPQDFDLPQKTAQL